MLKQLRLQFIIVNAVIIVALFTLLTGGAWFFLEEKIMERTVHISEHVMRDKDAGLVREPPPPPPRGEAFLMPPPQKADEPFVPPFFVVPVDPAGVIQDYTNTNRFAPEQVNELTSRVLAAQNEHGQFTAGGVYYYYARMQRQSGSGEIVFVLDRERDRFLLREVIGILLLAGVVCLILSVLGSIFLGNRAIKPIGQAWQQQKDFLADASHELRTPLSVIRTNLEIVLDNPAETVDSQNNWLRNIQEETAHMSSLVDGLLFLARTDANQNVLDCRQFPIQQAVANAAGAFAPSALAKGVALEIAVAEKPLLYHGDEKRLRQVVAILLDNAVRHTAQGGRVTVSVKTKAGQILLCVADDGEGIQAASLAHVFERFYQGDAAHATGKAGLGLAIAKSIVERHGGKIWATSEPNVETAFFIALPLSG